MTTNTNQQLYDELLQKKVIYPTSVKPLYANNTQKEYVKNRFYDPNNLSFSIYYLNSNEFLEDMKKNPLFLGYIPNGSCNENDVWDLISNNPYSILSLDEEYITEQIYTACVMHDPRLLGLLPDYLQTPDLVFHAVSKEPLILQFVRDDLRLFYICKAAVQKNWEAIKYVPKDIIDEDIIDLALKDSSAFILDLVEHSQITSEIYVKQLMAFPTDGATHLITTHLVENIDKLKELIYLIENLDSYAPQFIFKNCDPKILSHNSKHEALCGLLQVKPEWIQYLDNCIIDTDIFKIAMNKGIDLKLDAINYKKEFFEIIFYANKKAYLNVPKSRFNSIGSARIKATIIEAIDEGWINEVPNYFFTYEILEDDDLRDLLSQHREETALIKQNVLDFDKLLNANCSACEYSLLHTKIPSSIVEQFMSKHVDAYAGLEDSDKTLEFTKAFLKEYPNQISHIPSKFRNNEEVMRDLVADNFHLNRYLSTNDMLMINS
ncbi:hypothetical protein HLH17_02090 [Acinetobacter sp. ANC 5380]|uniref:DUF4116 domain-containing protein n=1 Tax=Acinetobacter terrae TaxID=2731247 RepID=A0A7Y2W9Q4_9GAMM|nr:hypothetical protein [Acinetobacter terrae]NNH76492.1 hypothetical protein [Acinetobacter terrae]